MTTPLEVLEARARALVDGVADDPEGRYRLRERFYARWGFAEQYRQAHPRAAARATDLSLDPYGYGASELAFMRWEIDRGVLDPVGGSGPSGSPWWRAVNSRFLYLSELAGLVAQAGLGSSVDDVDVRYWLEYFADPRGPTWYRAHNACIVRAYLDESALAEAESPDEQLLMNEVLYRLLFAEAMEMGDEAGWLGEIAADPELFAVDLITHLHTLYPDHYPLTEQDVIDVRHLGTGLEADFGRFLDETLILQHVDRLYALIADTVDAPLLPHLIKDGVPIYPRLRPEPTHAVEAAERAVRKQRVLILGAGMAGLSAAYELTSYPGWSDLYDVTVEVLGWRVGGKTATGRGPAERVEEHGIHILQGWYHNLFRTMKAVFEERARDAALPPLPWASWYDALRRNDSTFLTEYLPELGCWANNTMIFPQTPGLPGEGPPLSPWEVVRKMVGVVFEVLLSSPYAKGEGALARWILDHFFPPDGAEPHEQAQEGLAERALAAVHAALERMHLAAHAAPAAADPGVEAMDVGADVLALLEKLVERLAKRIGEEDIHFRLIAQSIEYAAVALRGILGDVWDPATRSFQWSRIDGEDYRAWLARWGATDLLLNSPIVRFAYTGLFANLADGEGAGGLVSAGTALRTMVEAGGYKGSFVWQLSAGTGDTMIMPLYDVLVARGVRFEFFRQVQEVHRAGGAIASITVGEQVTLTVAAYDPVVQVGDLRAWPAEPRYEQIDPAQAELLRKRGVDLEDPWSDWKPVRSTTLTAGQDYDQVVLAVPVAALPDCCGELVAEDERWASMVREVRTTGTVGVQLWVKKPLADLGLDRASWGLGKEDCAPNAVTYESILYSWLDQSCVLPYERWTGAETPVVAAYFTGTLPDPGVVPPYSDHDFPRRQRERAKGITEQWLQDKIRFFWPRAVTREFPEGFDLMLLCHPTDPHASAAERLDAQFYRANLSPTMRFTLSVPGSAAYRLRVDASGYANLFLAGDWTDFGLNVGYIEGALISGVQAAQALRRRHFGQTAHRVVWTDPGGR